VATRPTYHLRSQSGIESYEMSPVAAKFFYLHEFPVAVLVAAVLLAPSTAAVSQSVPGHVAKRNSAPACSGALPLGGGCNAPSGSQGSTWKRSLTQVTAPQASSAGALLQRHAMSSGVAVDEVVEGDALKKPHLVSTFAQLGPEVRYEESFAKPHVRPKEGVAAALPRSWSADFASEPGVGTLTSKSHQTEELRTPLTLFQTNSESDDETDDADEEDTELGKVSVENDDGLSLKDASANSDEEVTADNEDEMSGNMIEHDSRRESDGRTADGDESDFSNSHDGPVVEGRVSTEIAKEEKNTVDQITKMKKEDEQEEKEEKVQDEKEMSMEAEKGEGKEKDRSEEEEEEQEGEQEMQEETPDESEERREEESEDEDDPASEADVAATAPTTASRRAPSLIVVGADREKADEHKEKPKHRVDLAPITIPLLSNDPASLIAPAPTAKVLRPRMSLVVMLMISVVAVGAIAAWGVSRALRSGGGSGATAAYRCTQQLCVTSGNDVQNMFTSRSGSDGGLAPRELSPGLLTRLQGHIVARPEGALTAPFTGRPCVIYSASASPGNRQDGVHQPPLAYHSAGADFALDLELTAGSPPISVTVHSHDVKLFDMVSGRFACERTFADADDACKGFVLAHPSSDRDTSSQNMSHADVGTLGQGAIEFRECALLVGSMVTCVGELVRDGHGGLGLVPWRPPSDADAVAAQEAGPWLAQAVPWLAPSWERPGRRSERSAALGDPLANKVSICDDPSLLK